MPKGRLAYIEPVARRDFAEDDEAMNGDDDRREQERPNRVLGEAERRAGQLPIPQAMRHEFRHRRNREHDKQRADDDRSQRKQQAPPVAVYRRQRRHDRQAAFLHGGNLENDLHQSRRTVETARTITEPALAEKVAGVPANWEWSRRTSIRLPQQAAARSAWRGRGARSPYRPIKLRQATPRLVCHY